MGTCAGKRKSTHKKSNLQDNRFGRRYSSTPRKEDADEERSEVPSSTSLYELPLEVMDFVLQKSYLRLVLNSSHRQRDEDALRSLLSVDVCFYRRIIRQRFKKTICRHLEHFYDESKKRSAIFRSNNYFFLRSIQPKAEFIDSLFSLSCITEEQSQFVQRQLSERDKNAEILRLLIAFDEKRFSNFVKCLRQTDQTAVAKIAENGGVVINVKVKNREMTQTASMNAQLLQERICNLRTRTKSRSHHTNEQKDEDIEVLNCELVKRSWVVWIWCRSQASVEHLQSLYESNQLRDLVFEYTQPSASKMISIDRSQFKKSVVICPICVNFAQRIDIRGQNEYACGVTKLRNEIYVLCESYFKAPNKVCVFEDRYPFNLSKKIRIKEIVDPFDIESNETENCLYVSSRGNHCVWKIMRKANDEHKVMRWLITGYQASTLSVTCDGQLLVVNQSASSLMIYGSDAKLLRSIQITTDVENPIHAVQTSVGNFIVIDRCLDETQTGSGEAEEVRKWDICELSKDGQTVIRRYIPSHKTQQLKEPLYLSLDADDRIFVADTENNRVVLLNSDLKWNRIFCPTEEKEERKTKFPWRLCYDKEIKQLIVAGDSFSSFRLQFGIYNLSGN